MVSGTSAHAASERVRLWIVSSDLSHAEIAAAAGVDEKTIRNVRKGERWNPTVETLAKIEAIVPAGWQPDKRAA